MYHVFLSACTRGARKQDCWVHVAEQWGVDHSSLGYMQPHRYCTRPLLGAAADVLISSKIVLRQKLELEP